MAVSVLTRSLLALACCAAVSAQAATLVHAYELNGNLDDSVGILPLLGQGGVAGPTGYSFEANQGLTYQEILGGFPGSPYSIDMRFSLADVEGYRKLVDFKSLVSDTGLYALGGQLNFYNTGLVGGSILPDTLVRVTLTRDATGLVVGYVEGTEVWRFDDSTSVIAAGSFNDLTRFFMDDTATAQGEASGGFVDYIHIYDGALTAAEAMTPSSVPEPAAWLSLLAGLGLLAGVRRRAR